MFLLSKCGGHATALCPPAMPPASSFPALVRPPAWPADTKRQHGCRTPKALLAGILLLALSTQLSAEDAAIPPSTLRVAIAQIGILQGSEDNLQKILQYIDKAADEKCRVVVFPEGALRELKAADDPETLAALATVGQAAARRQIYVMLGIFSVPEVNRRGVNWMVVFDPGGREIFRYTKLYDRHDSDLPRVFYIDGIPCSAIICADRWLRAVEELPIMNGARISFELSDNFESEWVPELGWYWYVARALRNNIYVIFANSATAPPDANDRHGHSAVIDPEGKLAAASRDACEEMVAGTLDLSLVTRQEAERRRNDPLFKEFWDMASRVRDREPVSVPAWKRYESPEVQVTIAAAQIAPVPSADRNVRRMQEMIREAASNRADIVAFPELPVNAGKALGGIRKTAKKHHVYVLFAAPDEDGEFETAYVVGPDGKVVTSYDYPGGCLGHMWFRVKGVSAVVTIGREALWNEISEMAAYAGAQLLFNLSSSDDATTRDLAVQAAFASFRTLTTFVRPAAAGPSCIWDDLQADEEIKAAVNHAPLSGKDGAPVIYASFAANCVAKAGSGEEIIYTTRKVNHLNAFREDTKNPQMRPWYSFGAQTITGCNGTVKHEHREQGTGSAGILPACAANTIDRGDSTSRQDACAPSATIRRSAPGFYTPDTTTSLNTRLGVSQLPYFHGSLAASASLVQNFR